VDSVASLGKTGYGGLDSFNLAQNHVFASVARRSKTAVMDSFAALGKTRSDARKDGAWRMDSFALLGKTGRYCRHKKRLPREPLYW